MKTLLNRIGVCGTQAANHNTMSNTNTPRSAQEMQSNNGWQVDNMVMSSESPTNHLLITYYSPTIVSMQSAAIKAVKRAYMSAWRYAVTLFLLFTLGISSVYAEDIIKVVLSGDKAATKTVTGTLAGSAATANMGNSAAPYKLNNDGAYVAVTLKSGSYFASGDVITITGANKQHLIYAGTPNSGTYLGTSSSLSNSTTTYTLPASLPANTTTIYVSRPSSLPSGVSGTWNGTITSLTVSRTATSRTFNSGEIVYFKDNTLSNLSGSAWKNSSGNIYAYFFGDGTAWSTYGDLVEGSWNAANAIYKFTVPGSGKKFTTVIFTRGTAATFDSGLWNQTTDQTTDDQCNNLFTISNTKSGDKYTGSWSKWSGTLVVTRGGTEATAAAGIDCGASAGTLTCSATRGTIKTYQWKQTTSDKANATNAVGTGTTSASFTPNTSTAGTYYYYCVCTDACGNTAETALSGAFKYNATAATYSVTHTLTNVTKTSGTTGAGAATNGVAYTAVFSANSGYTLPDAITVTIGGAAQTAGTGYTWTKATGTVNIPAAKVTGNIVITISGAVAASACSEPAKVTNEIARFFVPCGLSNSTGDGSTWAVTNQTSSTGDNTFTTSGFGGESKNWYTNPTTEKIYGKLSGDKSYIQLKLNTGNFKAGDVITAYFNRNSTTKTGLTLKTQGSSYALNPAETAKDVETSATYTLVADAIESDGTLKFFRANSSTYVNFIVVTREPECTAPTKLAVGSITATGATFTVTDAANTNNYEFYYSTSSTAPTSSTDASATSTSKTKAVTDLTAGTTYYAWVRSKCSESNKSDWVALTSSTFTTLCTAPTSVSITGTYHYFPGQTISLTASPTGGSGTATYQWYKGGTAEGNKIAGATSATYTKASCTFDDAGAYYCKVSTGTGCDTWSQNGDAFNVKILRLYVKTGRNGTDYGNVDFVRVGSTNTATASISLGENWDYGFNIADGCGHFYGNAGTMQYNNYGPWVTNLNGTDCVVRTTNAATYVFTIDFSNLESITTTITFPSSNQAAGKIVYFDNQVVNWSKIHYRIGRADNVIATAMTLVPGTANLYKASTSAINPFLAWQICDNAGWTGSNTIYRTYTNNDGYQISNSVNYEGGAITSDAVTVVPGATHSTGTDAVAPNTNCEFWNRDIITGMKTQNVSITAPTNGTITINYVDVNNAAQSFTSGNRDLAHTCYCTPTAEPAAGYELTSLTVNGLTTYNGSAVANRDPFVLTSSAVVAATFSPATYTVTLNTNGGTINAGNVTSYTYLTGATLPTNVTKAGSVFGGWYDNAGFTGTPVTAIGTSETGNKTYWAKWDTPLISWDLNVNASWSDVNGTTTDGTNITSIVTSTANTTVTNSNAADKTSKLALSSSATADKYVEFKFNIACGKKLTPSSIKMKVLNVGSSSGGKMTHKAELSDAYGHRISGTVQPATDGTLTDLVVSNAGSTYFQGLVSLKVWAWNHDGTKGTAFRMGKDVDIYGTIGAQATPAATLSWAVAPADGDVGGTQTVSVTASDGSSNTVTYTSNTPAKAEITSGGVISYLAEGTTRITASTTDACGNAISIHKDITVSLPSGDACDDWTGDPSSFSDNIMDVGTDLRLTNGSSSATTDAVWDGSGKVVVITVNGSDRYVQGHFKDGSDITSVTVSAATNQSSAKVYAIVFCEDDAFSSGVTVQTHSAPSASAAKDESKLVHTFTPPAGTKYFRIYRKYSTYGDNQTIRVYGLSVCKSASGFSLTYNANGGTGSIAGQRGTTLTVKSSGFTRSGYVFDHWNTADDDSGISYDPGDPITLTANTTLYAQWVEEMEGECSWAYYFIKSDDATSNGKTNNATVFSHTLGSASGGGTGSVTFEGSTYNLTAASGSKSGTMTVVIPSGKKANLFAVVKKNGTNKIQLKNSSSDVIGEFTPTTDFSVAEFDDIAAGTYTLTATGNLNWYMFAAYICADCADSRPEITGSLIGCPTVTLTATNYTTGALLQWYKKVGSDFVALDGETGTTYTATETGLYKLAAQKTCRLETEPVSVTISLAVAKTTIPTTTTTYEQNATATPITANTYSDADATIATSASEYKWQRRVYDGGWGAWADIEGATSVTYTPPTTTIGQFQYRAYSRNNCNEGSWAATAGTATVNVIASSTVTGSWKVDGANVTSSAKGYVKVVNAGGWYDVKATFTTTTATPTITMMTDGVKMDNRVVEGTTITARVYVPASAADTVRVKAAVEAVTTGTAYSSCEIILKLAVTQCASNTKLPVKSAATDAGSSYTGWRYYWETAGVGKITAKSGVSTISQESASYEGFSYRNGSNGSEYRFQTYIGGVSKVRVYVYNDANTIRTVSNVYYHTALFTDKPSGYEISPTIIYQYPDEGGIKGRSNSYFDIVLSSPMIPNSCLAIILNNNVKIYGVELTGSTGSGTVPTLQWNQSGSATLEDIHTSPGSSLMQKASIKTPANFKSIATIQYRSTNRDVATVDNATGEVTIVSPSTILVAETCSIAAKLPVSGCYAGSEEIYYRVIVDPCPDKAPVIATDRNDYCVGHEPVISITSYDGEITGWFKDGVKIPDTEGLTSITASGIGNYYVTTHKTCDVDVRSNSIVIVAAEAPSVTVLHSGWHIRRGREIGVPLQLFKVEGTNLTTTIAWTLNGAAHTLSGVTCTLVDGVYQMTGTPAGSGAATLTGTITVTNECGQSTTKSTTIIVDPAAANIQVAYVVKGTKGGGWTATQADNLTGLYTYLSSVPTFDVTACNGYNTTVLEDLLTYYSQYDVVVLTDYLNSGEKPGSGNPGYNKSNNISYSDAFGCLVDVKPMLTTEAYVSGKSQWTKVGLTSNPSDATNTDNKSLKMTLLCPAAAIFSNTIQQDAADGSKFIQVADALPGGTENKMLQGFEPTAAKDFVYMATVEDKDGHELITLCERQTQIRARLMVFGLNWHGSQVLNTDGNTAVKQIIEYLLNWDPAQVIDCAIYFNNRTNDGNWGTAGNWGPAYNHVPKYYENVRIEQPVTVNVDNAVAANVKIAITSEGNVTGASDATVSSPRVLNGKMEIAPTGALTVNGGIYMVDSKGSRDFTNKQQVPSNLLRIHSSASGQGALAFGETNSKLVPNAHVSLYSRGIGGTGSAADSRWQYVGIPYQDAVALYHFYGAWLCDWDISTGGWTYVTDFEHLRPFKGYALTQTGNVTYCEEGKLVMPTNQTINLDYAGGTYGAYNLLANSFTAPIDINAFEDDDFDGISDKTIYIYNTGKYSEWESASNADGGEETTTAGQYLVIPIHSAPYTSTLKAIPPLQGFYVKTDAGGGSLTIDYERTVLQIDSIMSGVSKKTTPLRAPRRSVQTMVEDGETGDIRVTTLRIEGDNGGGDMVHILTGDEQFTDGFDSGWDGEKWDGDDDQPQLTVHTDSIDYAVSSQPQLEGTLLNFRAGADEIYDMVITTSVRGLVLTDLVNNVDINLSDTTVYTFNTTNRNSTSRFIIRRKPHIITSDNDQYTGYLNAYAAGSQICVANNTNSEAVADLFDTTGKLISHCQLTANSRVMVDVPSASGVYLVKITTTEETRTIKVTF